MKPSSPLAETPLTTGNYFQFEYDKDCQRLQIEFLDHVDGHNLNGIMVRFVFRIEINGINSFE